MANNLAKAMEQEKRAFANNLNHKAAKQTTDKWCRQSRSLWFNFIKQQFSEEMQKHKVARGVARHTVRYMRP